MQRITQEEYWGAESTVSLTCDECGGVVPVVIEVGDTERAEHDPEHRHLAYLCRDCVLKALKLFDGN